MPKVQMASHAPGQTGRGRRIASTLAEINVVPLVDVMLVLLIIFMVTAPMIQRGVDLSLPVATRSAQIADERIFVSVPLTYRQDHIVYLAEEPIRAEILEERIRQKMEGVANKEVYLRGDGGVQYQDLMEVIDRLKAAGVKTVGLVTRMPGDR
ncbi:MAG: biopolymer transporter ExbD [Acidobacteria bacterium]|nr:biopolymer transporter ExbD [Acidobacteriota bacterium]